MEGGSSPQMRGAPSIPKASIMARRIIPADAGSTDRCRRIGLAHRDHPRRCGEHGDRPLHQRRGAGSSPQMRGAHNVASRMEFARGIIPADAGSTGQQHQWRHSREDHPRRCGEHTVLYTEYYTPRGSSPQMRGAPRWVKPKSLGDWIIPADAGSTPQQV